MTLHELTEAVAATRTGMFAASYIAPGGLDPNTAHFIPRTLYAWDKLRAEPGVRALFVKLGVKMEHPRKAGELWP